MPLSTFYPKLFKIIENWTSLPKRPPLLLLGIASAQWDVISQIIIDYLVKNPPKNFNIQTHPDIIWLAQDENKKYIEVEDTRNFITKLHLSNFELGFKVSFIPNIQALTVQSQNALLKTLEEPFDNIFLFLGAVSSGQILPTILSRCQVINHFGGNYEKIKAYLEENNALSELQKRDLINWSNENFILALKMASDYDYWEKMVNFLLEIPKLKHSERLLRGQDFIGTNQKQIEDFFEIAITLTRKKLHQKVKNGSIRQAENLAELLGEALTYHRQLKTPSGANAKLLLETFLLGM